MLNRFLVRLAFRDESIEHIAAVIDEMNAVFSQLASSGLDPDIFFESDRLIFLAAELGLGLVLRLRRRAVIVFR
jgi:hypothetical protein